MHECVCISFDVSETRRGRVRRVVSARWPNKRTVCHVSIPIIMINCLSISLIVNFTLFRAKIQRGERWDWRNEMNSMSRPQAHRFVQSTYLADDWTINSIFIQLQIDRSAQFRHVSKIEAVVMSDCTVCAVFVSNPIPLRTPDRVFIPRGYRVSRNCKEISDANDSFVIFQWDRCD